MTGWLLLAGEESGEACRIVDIRVAYDPPILDRSGLTVARASINGEHRGDLALSARNGCTVALGLLFRELNRNAPVARLWIDIEAQNLSVSGRSGELLFGLATYLRLADTDLPKEVPDGDFMATGTLDPQGNVGSVDGLALKIRAALAAPFVRGTKLFYPQADEGQIDDRLRAACRKNSLLLYPVDRIDEALNALSVPIVGSWPHGTSPFKALDAYDRTFSRVFFGRQQEIADLAGRLKIRAASGRPGALIIGASGAGKSSFCLAGLLPTLIKEEPDLEFAVWRPREALSGLSDESVGEEQLVRSLCESWRKRDAGQTGLMLERDSSEAVRLDDLLAGLVNAGHCRIFVVDQFEELFALNFAPEARVAFARFLRALQARGVWVLGTLRSEFYAHYLELGDEEGKPVLTPVFEGDGQYNLSRMGREALAQVIVRPAELAGLQFEQRASDGVRLVDVLLADAMSTDDALPLLGFALQELYEHAERLPATEHQDSKQSRVLTFDAYERLGGLAGAIGTAAEAAYYRLDREAGAALPSVLAALAVPSTDTTRETARPAALDQWLVGGPERRLIDALTNIRVLVSEQVSDSGVSAQVRVTHEALFSHWEEASRLLTDSRKNRLITEDLRRRADQWHTDGRKKDALLSSPKDILNARIVAPGILSGKLTSSNLPAFLNSSLRRYRTQRIVLYSTAAMVVLALTGLSGSLLDRQALLTRANTNLVRANAETIVQRNEARRQRDEAERQSVEAQRQTRTAMDQRLLAEEQRKLALAASEAERVSAQHALRSARDARREQQAAVRAREAAFDALNRTATRLADDRYREDPALAALQRDVLSELMPVYVRLLDGPHQDQRFVEGYARALDGLAGLQADWISIEAANQDYGKLAAALSAPGVTATPEILRLRDRIALRHAAVLVSYGDGEQSRKRLATLRPEARDSHEGRCLGFATQILLTGNAMDYEGRRDDARDAVLLASEGTFEQRVGRIECALLAAESYAYNNEWDDAFSLSGVAAAEIAKLRERYPSSILLTSLSLRRRVADLDYLRQLPIDEKIAADSFANRAPSELPPNIPMRAKEARAAYQTREVEAMLKELNDAEKIAPDNRRLLEARYFVTRWLGQYEASATKGQQDWLQTVERLIARDPSSRAIAEVLAQNLAIVPEDGAFHDGKGAAGQRCVASVDAAERLTATYPASYAAQRMLVSSYPCLARQADPDLVERYTRSVGKINSARLKLIELMGEEQSGLRLSLISAQLDALWQRGDAGWLQTYDTLVSAEIKRHPSAFRYVALRSILGAFVAKSLASAGQFEEARKFLDDCSEDAEVQKLICLGVRQEIARGGFGQELATIVGKPRGPEVFLGWVPSTTAVSTDNKGNQIQKSVQQAIMTYHRPLELFVSIDGRLRHFDDLGYSREATEPYEFAKLQTQQSERIAAMNRAFESGIDLHRVHRALLYGDALTSEERQRLQLPVAGNAEKQADSDIARLRDTGRLGLTIGDSYGTPQVTFVEPGSPAEQAGIAVGDRIIEIDGKPTYGDDNAIDAIPGKPGSKVRLSVMRAGLRRPIAIEALREIASLRSDLLARVERAGVTIEPQISRVASVLPGSPAEHAGLMTDDRIIAIDGTSTYGWARESEPLRTVRGMTITIVPPAPASSLTIEVLRGLSQHGQGSWSSSAFKQNSNPIQLDESLLNEKVVILLQGKNIYGDEIYTYLQLTLRSLMSLRDKMRTKQDFMPAEYGTVLASGRNAPSRKLRAWLRDVHNMVDVPRLTNSPY